MVDHYEILGIGRDASDEQIKKAYRRKAKELHPDREDGDDAAMAALNVARDVLLDHERRARYDKTGEDEPRPPSLQQFAENMIMQAFDQLLAEDNEIPAHMDPIKRIVTLFTDEQRKAERNAKAAELYLEKLERKAVRIKAKTRELPGHLWSGVIEQRRLRYSDLRAEQTLRADALKLAIKLLQEGYEGVFDPKAQPPEIKWSEGKYGESLFRVFGA